MNATHSSRIWLFLGALVLAVAGVWAGIGVLALFAHDISNRLEIIAAVLTGLGVLALLPLGLGLSRTLWEFDRRRVWRSLGDLAAIGMLALVLVAAGFVLVDALDLLGTGQDNDGVPDGNLVALMVFVGSFGLLAILLVVRRSPPPPPEEIALSDILGHAALARKAANMADDQLRHLDKALDPDPKGLGPDASVNHSAVVTAARGAADCVRIAVRCAGLTADQLMRTAVDVRFSGVIEAVGRRSRAGLQAYRNGVNVIGMNDTELAALGPTLRPLEVDAREARAEEALASKASEEAKRSHDEADKKLKAAEKTVSEKQAALDAAMKNKAPQADIESKRVELNNAKAQRDTIAGELQEARKRLEKARRQAADAREKLKAAKTRLKPSKDTERDLISDLRAAAVKCADWSKLISETVEWAADQAYATVETGEPSDSRPPKEEKGPDPAAAPAAASASAGDQP